MTYHLAYVSTASPPYGRNEIDAILDVSRRNNPGRGITGMMVYGGGNVIQALEGERGAVETLYAKIAADPRHRDVTRLVAYEDDRREFGDWTMAFAQAPDAEMVEGTVNALRAEALAGDRLAESRPLQRLLRTFLETNV